MQTVAGLLPGRSSACRKGIWAPEGRCQVIQVMCLYVSEATAAAAAYCRPGVSGLLCALPPAAGRHFVLIRVTCLRPVLDVAERPAHKVLCPRVKSVLHSAGIATGWEAEQHLQGGWGGWGAAKRTGLTTALTRSQGVSSSGSCLAMPCALPARHQHTAVDPISQPGAILMPGGAAPASPPLRGHRYDRPARRW